MSSQGVVQKNPVLTEIDINDYDSQLEEKRKRIEQLFAAFQPPKLQVFPSKPIHYRMRTEFSVWHEGTEVFYVMHRKEEGSDKPARIRVDSFPVASELVNVLMKGVLHHVKGDEILKKKLFQVNFHTTLTGEAMITLIYHKKLDDEWKELAIKMREALLGECTGLRSLHLIGRSRKQKICLDKDEVMEKFHVESRGEIKYIQVEGAFSQPNAYTCNSMLDWAVQATQNSQDHDLLELYCGNGNFTTAVAPNFRRVLATEISKSSVAAARRNFENNGVENIFVVRMSSEEFTEAWKSGRKYTRLEGIDLKECDFKTLLVDPPRAGLDPDTQKLMREFDRVVYISCNPDTLKRDFETAADIFEIESFAIFDQFPYTHHVECGLYLTRKKAQDQDEISKRPRLS